MMKIADPIPFIFVGKQYGRDIGSSKIALNENLMVHKIYGIC